MRGFAVVPNSPRLRDRFDNRSYVRRPPPQTLARQDQTACNAEHMLVLCGHVAPGSLGDRFCAWQSDN